VVPFRLVAGTELTAELRGDFRDGGWVQGDARVKDAGVWEASISARWGNPVQYKFFLDNNRWLLDPSNPRNVPDGKGNTNSLLESVSCAKWTCAPAQ
jgi:1,4-alpha-glucan branching enzyme